MGEQQRRKKLRRKSTKNVANNIDVTSCSDKSQAKPRDRQDRTGQRERGSAERMPNSSLWCDSEVVWCGGWRKRKGKIDAGEVMRGKECSAYLNNNYSARPRYVAQRPAGQVTFCSDAAPVAETLCVQSINVWLI